MWLNLVNARNLPVKLSEFLYEHIAQTPFLRWEGTFVKVSGKFFQKNYLKTRAYFDV